MVLYDVDVLHGIPDCPKMYLKCKIIVFFFLFAGSPAVHR